MWASLINMLFGVWVMVSPGLLGYERPAADTSYIIGPLVVSFSITAIWEVNRSVRWLNLPLALWLVAAGFLVDYEKVAALNGAVTGSAIAVLSFVRGTIKGSYGGGWTALIRKDPAHDQHVEVTIDD